MAANSDQSTTGSIDGAKQIVALEMRIDKLLEKIAKQRFRELENTRDELRGDLESWMSGEENFGGQKVQRMLADAYRIAGEFGLDVERLKRIQGVARSAILRSDFNSPGETGIGTLREFTDKVRDAPLVGNVVAYYGLIDKAEERTAQSMRKKVVQYKNLLQVYIKALTIQDPAEALAHMRSYAALVTEYASAQERQTIDADIKAMLAAQNGVVEFVGVVPLVGDAMDVLSIIDGEDLAGNKLTNFDLTVTGVLLAAPLAIEQAIKRRARIGVLLGSFAFASKNLGQSQLAKLNSRLADAGVGSLQNAVKVIDQLVPPKLQAQAKVLYARQQEARHNLMTWGQENVRVAAFQKGRMMGSGKINQFKDALTSGDERLIRRTLLAVQADKHAMQGMKVANVGAEVINAYNDRIGRLYRQADDMTKDYLAESYLDSYLKKTGRARDSLSENDLKNIKETLKKDIDIQLITNPGTGEVKVSFDRDVTARIRIDGEWKDIPAPVLDEAYGPAFYRAVHGTVPPNENAAKTLMAEMDQVSTDALHNEAYFNLDVALDPTKESVFNDPEQIGMVVAFKANHWFERAGTNVKKAKGLSGEAAENILAEAEGELEEGFRQLKKQYDKQITDRQKGLTKLFEKEKTALLTKLDTTPDGPAREAIMEKLMQFRKLPKTLTKVPDELAAGYSIIANIGHNETPASAMKKLAGLGMTPQDISKRIGDQVTVIHKEFPKLIIEENKQVGLLRYPDGWLKKRRAE